jgi:metallo-beta-lactamase family protein
VCFFGYQAAGTPRREIQQYGPKGGYVYLDGEKVAIRAHIETLGGYSAHADQAGLVRFARPKSFCLVHGEAGAKEALREALVVDLASGMRDL